MYKDNYYHQPPDCHSRVTTLHTAHDAARLACNEIKSKRKELVQHGFEFFSLTWWRRHFARLPTPARSWKLTSWEVDPTGSQYWRGTLFHDRSKYLRITVSMLLCLLNVQYNRTQLQSREIAPTFSRCCAINGFLDCFLDSPTLYRVLTSIKVMRSFTCKPCAVARLSIIFTTFVISLRVILARFPMKLTSDFFKVLHWRNVITLVSTVPVLVHNW